MRRREAIKNLSLGIGYVVSAPALMGVLESCSRPGPEWQAIFLNEEQAHLVTHLVDIILPPSDIPGGLELNLPQFVDKMCADLLDEADLDWFRQGSEQFSRSLASMTGKKVANSRRKEVLKVFESFFEVPENEKKLILERQRIGAEGLNGEDKDSFALYKFLFIVREFALLGYYTSEEIGKNVLVFDPIPGGFKPCIALSEVGNAWTIDP